MTIRHLHKDHHTTFCGLDAKYILMTYEPSEADCAECLKEMKAHDERIAKIKKATVADQHKLRGHHPLGDFISDA